jgi:uncharacterized protein
MGKSVEISESKSNFWVNLPVKNIERSKEFFAHLGFPINLVRGTADKMFSFLAGDNCVVVNLFEEEVFKTFTVNGLSDTNISTEVFFNVGANSKAAVDEYAETVRKAGGQIFAEPGEKDGWMYGCGFTDLDGHRWGILYMDLDNMVKTAG